MKDLLKGILASALGFGLALAAGLVALIVLAIALAGAGSEGGKPPVKVERGTFLVIGNGLAITDTPDDGMVGLGDLLGGGEGESVDLWRALEAVRLAAKDKAVAGILLAEGLDAGLASRNELRQALAAFAKEGKPVVAWMETPRVGDYWMGSVATTVALHPSGELSFAGLSSYSSYLGATLRQLGIGVQVTKVGKFKSAVEPFTDDRMSEPAKRQMQELLDEIWGRIVADAAKSRSMPAARLRDLAGKPGYFPAARALELKLVDKVMHRDELVRFLVEAGAEAEDAGSFRQMGLARYAAKVRLPKGKGGKLAVVYAEGDIVDGYGSPDSVGGDRLAGIIRRLRHDDEVKAVVLRVNSPGGSAYASEIMHRELELLREKGVPLVVSMGDTAASGGYYIAAPGDAIVADPMTITGSIGVFGLHFNYGDLAGRFALGTDGVKTAPYADLLEAHRAATPEELAIVQSSVDAIYEVFLGVVSRGRKLDRDAVHEVAQGRVWSGARALRLKLVDRLGGLRDAVELAREKAGAGELELVQVPSLGENRRTLLEALMEDGEPAPLFSASGSDPVLREMRAKWRSLKSLRQLNDRRGIYLIGPLGVEAR
jgi:protease-4